MVEIFNTYLYKPILAVLIFIYQNLAFEDLGLAIIILTIFIRIVLFPLFYKSAKDQALMQRIQPHIKKIQLDHQADKEKQARLMMDLYRRHRLNPFSGILLLFVQLPILIALYQVFLKEITNDVFMNHSFLGLVDLGEKSLVLTVTAALLQYFQAKLSIASVPKNQNNSQIFQAGKFMVFLGPILTFIVLVNFPAALGLYWATSTLFSLGERVIINKNLPKLEHDGELSPKNQ